MAYNLADKIAQAAKTGPNMTQAQQGGGDYEPPAAGLARARLVGYFETGKHTELNMQQKEVLRDKVDLVFELSGPNHPPRRLQDGTLVPHRITVKETLSLSDRANFFKLFGQMNYAGKATHMAQMLGDAFMVEVFHKTGKDKKTYANLKGPNGYNVKGTSVQDPLSGKTVTVDVDPPITEPKAFIWDLADKDMWDSIFIEGSYEERKDDKGVVISPARSKNVLQERIMKAENFGELKERIGYNADEVDLPDAETPERSSEDSTAGDDPLNGIG